MIPQGHIGHKHPQIPHGHAHGIQLGQLPQHGGGTGHEGLDQDDGAREHSHQLDAVAVDAAVVDLLQALGDELLGVLVVQQHPQGGIDAEHQHRELADDIAQGVDDHKQVAQVVILAQLLEGPVGAVGGVGVEAGGALVDDGRVKHLAHGNGAQDGAGHHHARQGDHALGEALAGVLHLIDVGRDLLAAAYRKDQNGQRGEVGHIEIGDQLPEGEGSGDVFRVGIDGRSREHHHDVQQGHDEGAGAGGSQQLLQGIQAPAGNVAAHQQDAEGCQLHIQGGDGVVGFRVAENGPAQGLQEAAALAGDVGNVAGPIGPARVIGQLGVGGLVDPGADAAALVLKGGAKLAHHQGIGDEVEGEHRHPAENDLAAVEIHKAVGHIAKAPHCGEGHKGQGRPFDPTVCFCFFHADTPSFSLPKNAQKYRGPRVAQVLSVYFLQKSEPSLQISVLL